jgi:hypothetical protein
MRLLLYSLVLLAFSASLKAMPNRWGADYFPNSSVITQDGEVLHFYDDLIKGKIVVVSFIFTNVAPISVRSRRRGWPRSRTGSAMRSDAMSSSFR